MAPSVLPGPRAERGAGVEGQGLYHHWERVCCHPLSSHYPQANQASEGSFTKASACKLFPDSNHLPAAQHLACGNPPELS